LERKREYPYIVILQAKALCSCGRQLQIGEKALVLRKGVVSCYLCSVKMELAGKLKAGGKFEDDIKDKADSRKRQLQPVNG
jgi:hypothetical protein